MKNQTFGIEIEMNHITRQRAAQVVAETLGEGATFRHAGGAYDAWEVTAPDTRVFDNWDGTIWNNRLEPRFEIKWAWLGANRRNDWYVSMDEGKRISRLQWKRYRAQQTERRETLGDAFKSAALRWIRKQPRMKTCKLEDIEKVERVWDSKGKRSFEITAKGKRYTIR